MDGSTTKAPRFLTFSTKTLAKVIFAALVVSTQAQSSPPSHASAFGRAKNLIDANPVSAKRNNLDAFVFRDVILDANGTEHVRMDRIYRGLPVFGGDVVVHSRGGKLMSVSHTVRSAERPSLNARVSAEAAVDLAAAALGLGYDYDRVPTLRKVIYARHMTPILAWEVRLQGVQADGSTLDLTYFVNANDGKLLLKVDNIHAAKGGKPQPTNPPGNLTPGVASIGIGRSFLNGDVVLDTTTSSTDYGLIDSVRSKSTTRNANNASVGDAALASTPFNDADNVWGNNTERDAATVAADVHYGAATSWDYFLQTFGRSGIRNDGAPTTSYVHVGNRLANAYWYGGAMYFGDGNNRSNPFVSLDIVGHEMSHGVTQATAGLIYSGESGGLNEATSDIFGTMVEHFANNPSDLADYTVGELLGKPIRYMYKPSLNGYNKDCYSAEVMTMGPHSASAIGNHFFYLLAEGSVVPSGTTLTPLDLVCNGNTSLQGVGRDAAQKIWYHALTRYMTSNTSYPAARAATLQAAGDLFGAGSWQQQAVGNAWSAVNVH